MNMCKRMEAPVARFTPASNWRNLAAPSFSYFVNRPVLLRKLLFVSSTSKLGELVDAFD
jgi:hypothetical protein